MGSLEDWETLEKNGFSCLEEVLPVYTPSEVWLSLLQPGRLLHTGFSLPLPLESTGRAALAWCAAVETFLTDMQA